MMLYSIHCGIFLSLDISYIMEILILVLFYYLAQNPDFSKSIQPLMEQLKDSQQMLNFLKDLASFTKAFGNIDPSAFASAFQSNPTQATNNSTQAQPESDSKDANTAESTTQDAQKEKHPQSPTSGIADEFIQNILDSYLNKAT